MGRWGKGLYDSDSSLDYLSEATDILIKEATYWFSPEQENLSAWWLQEALTIVEILLVFAEHDSISDIPLLDQHTAVRRWKETFLGVWDAEWNESVEHNPPYSAYVYRLEQRHIANILFDRLIELADNWQEDLPNHELKPFALKLPYFSVRRLRGRDGRELSFTGRFLSKFVDKLLHFIVFTLSEEHLEISRSLGLSDIEKVCVAVDLIGHLCSAYQVAPGLRPATIHHWLDQVISFWIDYFDHPERPIDVGRLAETDELYANVVTSFVHLITVAQLNPGMAR